jgi:hypothetical protein
LVERKLSEPLLAELELVERKLSDPLMAEPHSAEPLMA